MRKPDTASQSIIDPLPGYVIVDEDGATDGDDTHAMFFKANAPGALNTASYHLYREDGTKHDVLPDYLRNLDNELFTTGITDATITAAPEPACTGLLAAGGVLALLRRRSRSRG
jgi:hypothetical protein